MPWVLILVADVFETAWPFVLKYFGGVSKWVPVAIGAFSIPIMFLLAQSLKELPAATVYATFVGIATAATAVIGIAFFGESANPARLCSLLLVLAGVIGLNLFSAAK